MLVFFSSSSSASPSEGAPLAGYGCTPNSLPKFQHPSHELLKENGFTQQVYHKYRRRCLTGKLLHALPKILVEVSRCCLIPVFFKLFFILNFSWEGKENLFSASVLGTLLSI